MSDAPESLAGDRLLRAIDTIDEDVALIELWACALSSFAQPAPDYDSGANAEDPWRQMSSRWRNEMRRHGRA